jgi:hypothetical protein
MKVKISPMKAVAVVAATAMPAWGHLRRSVKLARLEQHRRIAYTALPLVQSGAPDAFR